MPSARVHWRSSCWNCASHTAGWIPQRANAACSPVSSSWSDSAACVALGSPLSLTIRLTSVRAIRRYSDSRQQRPLDRDRRQIAVGKQRSGVHQREVAAHVRLACVDIVIRRAGFPLLGGQDPLQDRRVPGVFQRVGHPRPDLVEIDIQVAGEHGSIIEQFPTGSSSRDTLP